MKDRVMKRDLSRLHRVVMRAACVIPLICCCAAAQATGNCPEDIGVATAFASNMHHLLKRARPAVAPSPESPAYFDNVPMTVIGVYGATMLDMLSGGPLVLVRWPDDCCSPAQRWHTGRHAERAPANPNKDGAHIFFLWPEL
ncbi:hypothetical protein [Paraburkholderia hospita]|uniref:hypothetical protein n=1 Tax=Paraburkholderia hospita TaxID=169430 RepID=UPI00103BCC15|nr:hypothetical protein [Paraburkholderia hospita]